MIGEGVGNLVAHDLGELVIGKFQFQEQARVDRHAAARHAPGIDGFGAVYQCDAPGPVAGVGILLHRRGYHAAGNHLHPVCQHGIVQQLVLLVQLAHGAHVGLAGFDNGRLRRNQHQLAAAGGAGGTAADQCRDYNKRAG